MTEASEPREGPEKELPLASGIPRVREDVHEVIEFTWRGERQRVEIRPISWGRVKELQRGAKVRTRVTKEVDPATGEEVDVRVEERDVEEILGNAERIFPVFVVAVNGMPWTRADRIEEVDPGFTNAFMEALGPHLEETMGAARKKSRSP